MPGPFDRLSHDAAGHFRLWFYAAVLALRTGLSPTTRELPFLRAYAKEIEPAGIEDLDRWLEEIARWEDDVDERLPLRDLRDAAGLERRAFLVLFLAGLAEEDAGFGALSETLLGPGHVRLTTGLAQRMLPADVVRAAVGGLRAIGALSVPDPSVPRLAWELAPEPAVWDALRGEPPELWPGIGWRPASDLLALDALILPDELAEQAARVPGVLDRGDAATLIVRGPEGGGRRTLVGAIARELERGVLELRGPHAAAGALATLLHALPVDVLDVAPGETGTIAPLPGYDGPRAVVLGTHGGVGGALDGALVLDLGIPGRDERRRHWSAALGGEADPQVVDQYRMTGGHIRRTAGLAAARAALERRDAPDRDDVRLATRTLHGQLLDTLAVRLPAGGDWTTVVVSEGVERELELLERRCLERERLAGAGGPALAARPGPGVRALLTGASGTGKTLAARVLAGRLGLDAYRLDIAAVVDRYLGETEKHLEKALGHAEAANAVLLIDEGDAFLTKRTAVHTANDRYANLETNYLLQRLESFEGILLVTTNAADRIDAAFRRRMDVIVDFRPPEPAERLRILALHLPEGHQVTDETARTVAVRCALTGGQLRNAALHAELLALEAGGPVADRELEEAIRREYRQAGSRCPLPAAPEAIGA